MSVAFAIVSLLVCSFATYGRSDQISPDFARTQYRNDKQRLWYATQLNTPEVSCSFQYPNLTICRPLPLPALIPRQKLLSPDIGGLSLSPDGMYVAYKTVSNGSDNIWVQNLMQHSIPRIVISDQKSKISNMQWTCSPGVLLYTKDTDGDENFRFYRINVTKTNDTPRRLTSEGAKSHIVVVNCRYPDTIILKSNDRDPRYFDLYKFHLRTGTRILFYQNNGFEDFMFDNEMRLRLASEYNNQGGFDYYEFENSTGSIKWKLYTRIDFCDIHTSHILSFDQSNNRIYWEIAIDDLTSLYISDFDSPRKRRLIYKAKRADVRWVTFSKCTNEPMFLLEEDAFPTYYALDQSVEADIACIRHLAPANAKFYITDTTYDFSKWLVKWVQDDQPPSISIYDIRSKTITHNFHGWPSLNNYKFAKTAPISLITRDAFVQLCYLTVPVQYTSSRNNRHTSQPIPVVLKVHGGPWGVREHWNFGEEGKRQLLANRGYGVLECNFRASGGFGKIWLNAGNGEWGRKMHYDLLDAVDWAVQAGVADKHRIAIMGTSYGGYATLVGLTETPNTFACGIDIVGPSNLETLMRSLPPTWTKERKTLLKRIGGSLDSKEGLEFLRSRSPYFSAHKIKRPLLIFQGANDPRVKRNESGVFFHFWDPVNSQNFADNIVRAIQAANIPVSYVLFPDEGHGSHKEKNRVAEWAITEQFLKQCLNGRAEDIGDDVKKSSAQIISRGTLHIDL